MDLCIKNGIRDMEGVGENGNSDEVLPHLGGDIAGKMVEKDLDIKENFVSTDADNAKMGCKTDSQIERKITEVTEKYGNLTKNVDFCNNIKLNELIDAKTSSCNSIVDERASRSGRQPIAEVKVEQDCVNSSDLILQNGGEESGITDQPLDLTMPIKRANNFQIRDKRSLRRKSGHQSTSKNISESCKSLSNSLHSLEKFGNEFDFNTTAVHIGYEQLQAMQNISDAVSPYTLVNGHIRSLKIPLSSPSSYLNNELKPLKIPMHSNDGLLHTFHSSYNGDTLQCQDRELNEALMKSSSGDYSGKFTGHSCTCEMKFTSLHELSIHVKKSGHKPISRRVSVRDYPKLVRGQDMWLNRGSEQTKRILRCIQCGQSFKSLPELTVHMMETQHYEKIVNSDHLKRSSHRCSTYCEHNGECVFKCKVCQEHFRTMDSLANHMVNSGHHKQSTPSSSSSALKYDQTGGRVRQKRRIDGGAPIVPRSVTLGESREKPDVDASASVNKVANGKLQNGDAHDDVDDSDGEDLNDRRITCENCQEKIHMSVFVDHVRLCLRIKNDALPLRVKREKPYDFECSETFNCQNSSPIGSDKWSNSPSGSLNRECTQLKSNLKVDRVDELNGDEVGVPLMDIIDPQSHPEGSGTGAIQAMESLIQQNFGDCKLPKKIKLEKKQKAKLKPEVYKSLATDESQASALANGILESMSKISQEILQSVYKKAENNEKGQERKRHRSEGLDREGMSECGANGGAVSGCSDDGDVGKIDEVDDDPGSRYITEDELETLNSQKDKSKSALDSLSSFVYGQKLTSEHPLERLEKLKTYMSVSGGDGVVKLEKGASKQADCKDKNSDDPHSSSMSKGRVASPKYASPQSGRSAHERISAETSKRLFPERNGHILTEASIFCPACSIPFVTHSELMLHFIRTRCHDSQRFSDLTAYKNLLDSSHESYSYTPFIYLPLDHTSIFTKYNTVFK